MKYAFAASAVLAAGAVAQSDLTCAGTGVTVAPTAVEYPVYISTYISAATVFNINGNANITINNAPTTLEIYTTGTSTVYATVTDTTTTTALAAATPTPTATTVDEPIILAINNAALKHKRQAGASGFLGGSAGVAATCGEAVVLSLTEGSLFINGTGEQFSTTPGVTQMDFMAGTSVGSITTTFGLNNGFVWDNSAFVGGSATFCLSAGGVVQGLFGNSTPVDCTSISFTAILASSCNNATTTSSASSSSITSSASINATSASIASSISSSVSSVSASLSSVISSIESSASSATANATSAVSSVSAALSSAESSASSVLSSATAAASSTTTAATTSVQVSFTSPTAAAKNKRQTDTTEYLMADGTFTTVAADAATFDLVDGQLFSGDLQFSTDADTDYAVFAATDAAGDITNTFDLSSGALMWTNGSFNIDDANTVVFAISSSTLYAAFQTIPPGATTVGLTASVVESSTVIASDSATSVSSTTSAETSAASSATTAASTTAASTTSSSTSASVTSSSSSSSSSASGAIASATSALNSTLKAKRYNGMARLHQRN